MRILACAMLLALFGLSAPAVVAQGTPESNLFNLSLEQLMNVQFYTASKHAQNISETPASVTVLTREDIRAYGYRTLADALEDVRGFWITSDRNYSYLGVRGFANPGDCNSRILLLLNGYRLNDNIYESALIGTEFPLDLDLVERIEIVRGPGSSLYGTNAMYGVINVITRQPPTTPMAEVSAEVSSLFTRKARITVGLPQLLDGAIFSATMDRSNGNENLYFPEFDSPDTNHGVAHRVDGDEYSSAFVMVHWKHFQLQSQVGSRLKIIPTASFGTIFNDPANHTKNSRGFAELSYQRDFNSRLQLTSRVSYGTAVYRGSYAYDVDGSRLLEDDRARGEWRGFETNVSLPIGNRNTITAGTEFRDNFKQDQDIGWTSSSMPQFNSDRQSKVFALYAQDEVRITSRLLINAGLRFDHYTTFGSAVSPRVAAIFHADSRTQIKFSFGQAFRAPNAYELFYSDGQSQEPNLGLRAERIASHNLSFERVLTPTFHLVVEAFYNVLSDALVDLPNAATGIYRYANVDEGSGKGLEFELDAQRKGARGEFSYTVQRSTDSQTGAVLPDSPQHVAKMKFQIQFPPALLAGMDIQYLAPQLTTSSGARLPGSMNMNLSVSTRKPVLGFDLSASCYNLLNRRNYDPPAPSLSETRVLQDSRGFRLQVRRSFSRR